MTAADDHGLPTAFREWLSQVDQIMKRDWYIDTHEAGTEIERLLVHWQDGDTPEEYVSWFAEKYDLIDFNY